VWAAIASTAFETQMGMRPRPWECEPRAAFLKVQPFTELSFLEEEKSAFGAIAQ